jgi:hypothetical protein
VVEARPRHAAGASHTVSLCGKEVGCPIAVAEAWTIAADGFYRWCAVEAQSCGVLRW